MTVQELIQALDSLPKEYKELEVVFRLVGNFQNIDSWVDSVKVGIVGGPTKADERLAMVLR